MYECEIVNKITGERRSYSRSFDRIPALFRKFFPSMPFTTLAFGFADYHQVSIRRV